MINIISGEINSGKTSLLLKEFKIRREGVGVFAIKTTCGYNALLLKYENKKLVKIEYLPIMRYRVTNSDINIIGKYEYKPELFNYINKWLILESDKESSISIDEIGLLEMKKEGYYNSVSKLINRDDKLYLSVRESIMHEFISEFNISHKTKLNII